MESELVTIPLAKLNSILEKLDKSDIENKILYKKLFSIYRESNIPIDYWQLSFDNSKLEVTNKIYRNFTNDLKINYENGKSILLCGPHGVGKTFLATNILKYAIKHNYSALYTDLFTIVSVLTSANSSDKLYARKSLIMTDFLVIDEVDDRFAISNNSSELYFSMLETILRPRLQNKLSTIICTNSPNILKSINGPLQNSLESLFSKLEIFNIFGEDLRSKR